jgi:hypothetical protein
MSKKSTQKANIFLDSPSGEVLDGNPQQQSAGAAQEAPQSDSSDESAGQPAGVISHVVGGGNEAPAGQIPPSNQTPSVQVVRLAEQVQHEPLTFGQVQGSSLVAQGPETAANGGQGSAMVLEPKNTLQVTQAEYEYLKFLVQRDRDTQRQRQQAAASVGVRDSTMNTTIPMDQSPGTRIATPTSLSCKDVPSLAFNEAFPSAFIPALISNPSPAFKNAMTSHNEVITLSDDSPDKTTEQTIRSKAAERKLPRKTKLRHQSGSSEEKETATVGGGAARPTSSPPISQRAQQASGKPALLTPKKPAPQATTWSCPNCGSKEHGHDAVLCTVPRRTDITRSIAEEQWLKQLDKLRRDQRRVQYQQMREAAESEEGSEIHSESSSEEEEEEEDDGEGSSYLDDTSSYQPSSVSSSSQASSQEKTLSDRLARIEAILLSGQGALQHSSSAKRAGSIAAESQQREQFSGAQLSTVRFSASPQRSCQESPSKLTQGMLGCPELERREDLLVLSKFEALEKKYADYVDRAQDHDRTPQTMAHCFRRYLPTIVMTLNSLLSRDAAVRRKFNSIFAANGAYVVTEEMIKAWDAHTFRSMYKELCTAKTFMASEVITQLMDTKFSRHPPRGQDPYTLTAFVMQATTAFQEKLDSMPTQTVKRCSDSQLRDSFVKMILGKDDRHLADFSHCYNWMEAAQSMFDLEGTGQGVNFMRQALLDHTHSPDHAKASGGQTLRAEDRGGDRPRDRSSERQSGRQDRNDHFNSSTDSKDWALILRRLSAEIEHTPKDLEGHVSDKEKVKRLLSLRDSRRRQQEIKSLTESVTHATSAGIISRQEQHARDQPRELARTPRQGSPVRDQQRGQGQQKESGSLRAPAGGSGNGQRSQSQLGPSEGTQGPRCYNCHNYGHLAKDCPKIGAGNSGGHPLSRSRDSSTGSTTRRNA